MAAESDSVVSATQASADTNAKVDVNTLEQTDAAVFNEARSWAYNLKKLADDTQAFDQRVRQTYFDLEVERARANNRYSEMLSQETLIALSENRGARQRDVYHSEDRFWNPDEVAQLTKSVPAHLDALTTATIYQLFSRLPGGVQQPGGSA